MNPKQSSRLVGAAVLLALTMSPGATAQTGPQAGPPLAQAPASGPAGLGAPPGQGEPPSPFPMVDTRTEAQKLVASLPPPAPGGMMPAPEPAANAALPNEDPRDFGGAWFHNQNLEFRIQRDMYGFALPYTMAGAKVLERRVMSLKNGTPFLNASAICRPPGQQWQHDLNMPFLIYMSKDWVEFVFEEYHNRWKIVLDRAKAPPPASKQYMGYSAGRWDGDTLVVETRDFRQAIWLDVDGTPMSAEGRLIQRIRKIYSAKNEPVLEIVSTIDDPTYYTKPWSIVRSFGWQPMQGMFYEYNCEEQIGDPSGSADAGLVPEPTD